MQLISGSRNLLMCRTYAPGTNILKPHKIRAKGCSLSVWRQRDSSNAPKRSGWGVVAMPGVVPISTGPAERAEPLKCLGSQLQGKLARGNLSTEHRSFSGV